MMTDSTTEGYATTYALVALIILSVAATSAAGPEMIMGRRLSQLEEKIVMEEQLQNAIGEVIEALILDPTPEADSRRDPVWNLIADGIGEIELSLSDVSTGIDLNTFPLDRLREPSLAIVVSGSGLIEPLAEIRSKGFIRSPETLDSIIPEGSLGQYFSIYGYFHPRICDSQTIENMLHSRLDSENVELASNVIESAKIDKTINAEDWHLLLQERIPDLLPIVSAEAMVNVNFADRELIEAILEFQNWGPELDDPGKVLNALLFDRNAGEILPLDLTRHLSEEADAFWIQDFLGTKTWFWKIGASFPDGPGLEVVVAQIPGNKITYQVIERRRLPQ